MEKNLGKNPIIIFGTGRSGTTIFTRMLSEHPNLYWLSNLSAKYPDKIILNRTLMRALDFKILNRLLRKRYKPIEAYPFWEFYCKGFRRPFRDLLPTDITVKSKHKIQYIMSKMTTDIRKHLLLKITGWPRLGLLSEIFPNAKFIHVLRDGRAVANSLIDVEFWDGWGGPEKWRWGPLSAKHSQEWYNYDKSFIVLAAIQWKILMDATEKAKKYVKPSNLTEIRYEQLCSHPLSIFKEIADFCDIEWTTYFENRLKKYQLKNTNHKWTHELNINQQRELNEVLVKYLKRYDYL